MVAAALAATVAESRLGSVPIKLSACVGSLLYLRFNLRLAQTELTGDIVDSLLLVFAVELGSVLDTGSISGADKLVEYGNSVLAGPISVADEVTDRGSANGVAVLAALPLNDKA